MGKPIAYYYKTWMGRYLLSGMLLGLGGILFEWLNIESGIYVSYVGAAILLIQTLILIGSAIYFNFKRKR